MWYAHKQTHTHLHTNEWNKNQHQQQQLQQPNYDHNPRILDRSICLAAAIAIGWIGIAANSSYDEDDDYEPNIDILESQLDDSILNEWWDTVKIESAEDFERAERAIQEHLDRL